MKAAWVLVMLSACRLGFDATTDGAPTDDDDDGEGDASDEAVTEGDSMMTVLDGGPDQQMISPDVAIDAPPTQCESAIVVTPGTRMQANTCHGDLVDGCAAMAREEVVFEFTPPASGGYNARAFNPGTNNVSNSVARVDAACAATMGACAGILGTTYQAGQTYYFVVEASSSACVDIEFLID